MKKSAIILTVLMSVSIFAGIEIDFEQRTFWHVRERETVVKGKIILGDGNKFNIRIGKFNYISNGDTLWEYNSRQKQVRIQKLTPELSKTVPKEILELLEDDNFLKNPNKKTVTLKDTDGNIVTYTIEKAVVLNNASDSMFNFIIPQGAQVYDD